MKRSNQLIWFPLIFICLLIGFVSCGEEQELPNQETELNLEKDTVPHTLALYVWVDQLNVRDYPSLDSTSKFKLSEGARVLYNHEKSTEEILVNLRGQDLVGPFYKIKTKSGKMGWVFSGALTDINPSVENEIEFNGDTILVWEKGISNLLLIEEISEKSLKNFGNSFGYSVIPNDDPSSMEEPNSQVIRFADKTDVSNYFYIQFEDSENKLVRTVHFEGENIPDQYGIYVGDSYEMAQEKRKGIVTRTLSNGETYASVPGSNILYRICCPEDGSDQPQYSDEETKSWTIDKIIWQRKTQKG